MSGDGGEERDSRSGAGLAAVGLGALAVACCGAVPLLVAALGGVTAGAVFGIAAGAIALVAGAVAVVVIRRRHRACARTEPGSDGFGAAASRRTEPS